MLTDKQREQYSIFANDIKKKTHKDVDYLYSVQGDVKSRLISDMLAEGISYVNVGGPLLIKRDDLDKVRKINKEILERISESNIETNIDDLRKMFEDKNIKMPELVSMDGFNFLDVVELRKNVENIPGLIFSAEMDENNKYTISVSKDKLCTDKSDNFASAYLKMAMSRELGNDVDKRQELAYDIKVDKYIQEHAVSQNEYYITSEIDPSVFIGVGRDGFNICHWQIEEGNLKRVIDLKVAMNDENYLPLLHKAVAALPDIRIADNKAELNNFMYRRGKGMRKLLNLKALKEKRGVAKFVKAVNHIILNKDKDKMFGIGEYNQEVAKILDYLHSGVAPEGYDIQKLDALKSIVRHYGIDTVNFKRVSSVIKEMPECYDTVIEPQQPEKALNIAQSIGQINEGI